MPRTILIAACLASASVHAALALPQSHGHAVVHHHARGHTHMHAIAAPGAHPHDLIVVQGAFLAAAAALVVVGAGIACSRSMWPPRVAAALLTGLIAAYVLTRTVALPGLDGTPEAIDTIGVFTKLVEVGGVAAALGLERRLRSRDRSRPAEQRSSGRGTGVHVELAIDRP